MERKDIMSKHDTAKKGPHKEAPEVEAEGAKSLNHPKKAAADAANAAKTDAVSAEQAEDASIVAQEDAFAQEIAALKALASQKEELASKKEAEAKEHYDRLTYMAAEFDNYRRRTQKEKEKLFTDAIVEVSGAFLPVIDNLERALKAAEAVEAPEAVSLRDGVAMVMRQCIETFGKLGVQEIEALGATFDPNLHNAVMHIEDDAYGASEVVDVFQKGYRYKEDTVVRHAMVKVAN